MAVQCRSSLETVRGFAGDSDANQRYIDEGLAKNRVKRIKDPVTNGKIGAAYSTNLCVGKLSVAVISHHKVEAVT